MEEERTAQLHWNPITIDALVPTTGTGGVCPRLVPPHPHDYCPNDSYVLQAFRQKTEKNMKSHSDVKNLRSRLFWPPATPRCTAGSRWDLNYSLEAANFLFLFFSSFASIKLANGSQRTGYTSIKLVNGSVHDICTRIKLASGIKRTRYSSIKLSSGSSVHDILVSSYPVVAAYTIY